MFLGAEFTSYFLVWEVKHEVECCEDITARITASLYVTKGLALWGQQDSIQPTFVCSSVAEWLWCNLQEMNWNLYYDESPEMLWNTVFL